MKTPIHSTLSLLSLGFIILAGACTTTTQKESSSQKPNVIILFSDQHSKKVMGFEGHPDVLTPNLDQLANEAVIFDRATK